MTISIDRESVCMGDDCMPHKIERKFHRNSKLSELLTFLTDYVPSMKNVVWAVISLNTADKAIGYIIMDNNQNIDLEITEDLKLSKLFIKNITNISVFCRYFHGSSFPYQSSTKLIDKVKKEYAL